VKVVKMLCNARRSDRDLDRRPARLFFKCLQRHYHGRHPRGFGLTLARLIPQYRAWHSLQKDAS
jgi:hypothetical protein